MKKKLAILLLSVSILSVSCKSVDTKLQVKPNISTYNSAFSNYKYVVDEHTDVVYLMYLDSDKCGLTVMLNKDGTPVSRNQLNLNK